MRVLHGTTICSHHVCIASSVFLRPQPVASAHHEPTPLRASPSPCSPVAWPAFGTAPWAAPLQCSLGTWAEKMTLALNRGPGLPIK